MYGMLVSSVFKRDLNVDKLTERSEMMLCGRLFPIVGMQLLKRRSEKNCLASGELAITSY